MKMHSYVYLSLIIINFILLPCRAMDDVVITEDYGHERGQSPELFEYVDGRDGSSGVYLLVGDDVRAYLECGDPGNTVMLLKAVRQIGEEKNGKNKKEGEENIDQEEVEKISDELAVKKSQKQRQRLHEEHMISQFLQAMKKIKDELNEIETQVARFEKEHEELLEEIAAYEEQEREAQNGMERNMRLQMPQVLVEAEASLKGTIEEKKVLAEKNRAALKEKISGYERQLGIQKEVLGKLVAECASRTVIKEELERCLFKCNEGLGRIGLNFPGAVSPQVTTEAIQEYYEEADKLSDHELEDRGLGVGERRKLKKKKTSWWPECVIC